MQVLMKAKSIAMTVGPMSVWSTAWWTETLIVGKGAFMGIMYSAEDAQHHYQITCGLCRHEDSDSARPNRKAGARLAQILKAIWPD